MNNVWDDVKMMKGDEFGAIFVNEGLGRNLGRVTLGNFGVGKSEFRRVYIDLGVIVTRLECDAARLCNGYIFFEK